MTKAEKINSLLDEFPNHGNRTLAKIAAKKVA